MKTIKLKIFLTALSIISFTSCGSEKVRYESLSARAERGLYVLNKQTGIVYARREDVGYYKNDYINQKD